MYSQSLLYMYLFHLQKTGEIPRELKNHPEFCDALLDMSRNPRSLQQMCRFTVRSQLHERPVPKIEQLNLPKQLKDYLALAECG